MRLKQSLLALAIACTMALHLNAQPAASAAPVYTQSLIYVKVAPGKNQEWMKLMRATSAKVAQMRADAGEIVSWALLRSVYPAGQEARADYLISMIYEGGPRSIPGASEELYKKAGVTMTVSEANAMRSATSTLVAAELWRPRIRVGSPAKGHYLFINYMKVLDAAKYSELETKTWAPMSQEWVKQGAMSGWSYATKILPGGSETAYTAYTADMFPTMEAAFKNRDVKATFEKVAPGMKFEETFDNIGKVRDLARRELWTVVERVTKKQ